MYMFRTSYLELPAECFHEYPGHIYVSPIKFCPALHIIPELIY